MPAFSRFRRGFLCHLTIAGFMSAHAFAQADGERQLRTERHGTSALSLSLEIEAIDPFVTMSQPAPARIDLPRDVVVRLRATTFLPETTFSWTGVDEVIRNGKTSTALCTLSKHGTHSISVTVSMGDSSLTRTLTIEVGKVRARDIRIRLVEPEPGSTGVGHIGAPWACSAAISHPAYAHLIEWQTSGGSPASGAGPTFTPAFEKIGRHDLQVGPDASQRAAFDIYAVTDVSHNSSFGEMVWYDIPIRFAARTSPPGYESYVPWNVDTMHDMFTRAEPATGRGASFTTTFRRTTAEPSKFTAFWAQVQAGNLSALQNPDAPPPQNTVWSHTKDEQNPPCDSGILCTDCPDGTALHGYVIPSVVNACCTPCSASGSGDPVLTHSGEVFFELTLPSSSIPGRGDEAWQMPLVYRSQIDFAGPVGVGWNLAYVTDRIVPLPNGNIVRYEAKGARFDTYGVSTRTASGRFQVFSVNPDGTISFHRRDGFVSTYAGFDGTAVSGRLLVLRDRNGNELRFTHNPLGQLTEAMDSMGRRVTYHYDAQGMLDRIEDWLGRATLLSYDAQRRLVTVTMPPVVGTPHDSDGIASNGVNGNDFPAGKTYRFRYSASSSPFLLGNLEGVTYPNEVATGGPERLTYVYGTNAADYFQFDRVTSSTVGGGRVNLDPVSGTPTGVPAGGTFTFAYATLAPRLPGELTTEVRKTTVVDSNGNLIEHYFNSNFNEVRRVVSSNRNVNPVDPATFTMRKSWNADALMTSITLPEGNRIEYTYDGTSARRTSQGNLLEIAKVADSARGGDESRVTTSFTYEPIYNGVRTTTTPRGNDTAFAPPIPDDPVKIRPIDFNLDGDSNDPSDRETPRRCRYTTLRLFDYQERSAAGITSLAAALGIVLSAAEAQALSLAADRNGDGTTSQGTGNLIAELSPNVVLPDGSVQVIERYLTYNALGQMTSRTDPEGNLTTYYYFPETDPDGNGVSEGLARPANSVTGGYLRMVIGDDDPALAATPALDPVRPAGQAVTNAGTAGRTRPAPFVLDRSAYTYDPVGNTTSETNGRGVRTLYRVNALNQIIEIISAQAHGIYPPVPAEPLPLLDFQYVERYFFDYNNNLIRNQIEDRGNISGCGGNNPTIPFVDRTYVHDLLDQGISMRIEVSSSSTELTRYRWDPAGNRVLTIKPEGNAVSHVYDERGLLYQTTRGATAPPILTLLAAGDPTTYDVRGGAPSTTTAMYDGNGNLLLYVDAEDTDGSAANNGSIGTGDRTRYLYDGLDRRTSVVDSVGNQTVYQYDPDDRLIRESHFGPTGGASPSADGPVTLARPVSSNGAIQPGNLVNTSLLAAVESRYDEMERVYQLDQVLFVNTTPTVRPPDVLDGALDAGKGSLTPGDNQAIPGVTGVSILGRVTRRTQFDRNSQAILQLEDDGDQSTFLYDGQDRQIKEIDPAGNSVELAYDDDDHVIEMRETDVSQVAGVASETFITTSFFDSLDRLSQRVDNIGQTFRYLYDSRHNLVSVVDARGPVTTGSITRRLYPPGARTLNTINDPGNVTLLSYDGPNRLTGKDIVLTSSGQGDGVNMGATVFGLPAPRPAPDLSQGGGDGLISVRFEWDDNSLLASQTDDNLNQTSYQYDNLDRQVGRTRGLCLPGSLADVCSPPTVMSRELDRDDNTSESTDENGSVTTNLFDAVNRRVSSSISRGSGVEGTTLQTLQYDGLSRVTRSTDDNDPSSGDDDSTVTDSYDSLGRVIEEGQTIGMVGPRQISSSWRAETLRTKVIYPNGRVLLRGHDALDRLNSVSDAAGSPPPLATYEHFGPGRVLRRTYANGAVKSFLDDAGTADIGYDGIRRPIRVRHRRAGGTLADFTYAYDRMDNRLSESKLHDPSDSETYAYDSAYRLLSFSRSPGGLTPLHSTWSLDGVGNWTNVDLQSRQHSSFNELLSAGATLFAYDDNGNQIDDGIRTYSWDHRDRLRRVARKTDGATLASYAYDALGRRIRKVVSNSGSANGTTLFFLDRWQDVEERDAGDALQRQYVYGKRLDEVLVLDRNLDGDGSAIGPGDSRLFYHDNVNQSVSALTNSAGITVEGYQYDAYGRQTVYGTGPNGTIDWGGDDTVNPGGAGSFRNPFLFTGRRWDAESSLYHYRHRYFSPEQGRFLGRDPIGYDSPSGRYVTVMGLYEYVNGSPANWSDPYGTTIKLTIYVDQPGAGGDSDAWEWDGGMGADVGHSFFHIYSDGCQGLPYNNESVGFYPDESIGSLSAERRNKPRKGRLNDDTDHEYDVKKEHKLTAEQGRKFKEWLHKIQKDVADGKREYQLNKFNCTTFVCEGAKAAGVSVPSAKGKITDDEEYDNPGAFGEELKKQKGIAEKGKGPKGDGTITTGGKPSKGKK